MYCKQCGKNIPDNVTYCPSCGAAQTSQYSSANGQPQYGTGGNYGQSRYGSSYSFAQPLPQVGFADAVKRFFTHYADFSGRARRSEFWFVVLFQILVSMVLGAIMAATDLNILASIWSAATLIPVIAICVRRLHDVGKSGVWYLWALLPIAGGIILLVQFCKDSEPGANQYGPSPKYQ